MMFNVRNTTITIKDDLEAFVQKQLDGVEYELELKQGSYPFKSDSNNKLVQNICKSIAKVTGVEPKHSTAGGTSDARFVATYGIAVVEFGVINDTIHSINERTSIAEVEGLGAVFLDLIKQWK
jgi:succinyl-diaminopimelate desuccinylase